MRSSRRAAMRLVALSAVLVAGALGPGVADAQPAARQQSAVSPGFLIAEIDLGGSFNAVSDPGGANPSGQVLYHFGGGLGPTVGASVTCLSVSGNTAVIGFQGNRFPFELPPIPLSGELVVADNGRSIRARPSVPGYRCSFRALPKHEPAELLGPRPRQWSVPRVRGHHRHGRPPRIQGAVQKRRLGAVRLHEPGVVRRLRQPRRVERAVGLRE